MRQLILIGTLLLAPVLAAAQEPDVVRADSMPERQELPRQVAREVAALYNMPAALRVEGPTEIEVGREVDGHVAVLHGPLTVAGTVLGQVVAVNGDVVLRSTARIRGDLVVVGGTLVRHDSAVVGGDIRIHRQPLVYRREGGFLVADLQGDEDRWWRRWEHDHERNTTRLSIATGRTYNRVEGLPTFAGFVVRRETAWGKATADLHGIVRSSDFTWTSDNLGHRASLELRFGKERGLALGGRLFDVVEGVEPWIMSREEVGLASFFFRRDYLDYFGRHGGRLSASLFAGPDAEFVASLSDERWSSRAVRDPFTIFRNGSAWRENPTMDDGRFHVANVQLRFDTRTSRDDPWAGWYIVADVERGSGRVTSAGPTSPGVRAAPSGPLTYTRGFLDLRRYNRIAPDAQLNLRLVLGSWLGGDPLPLQRRFSVGGVGSLPGFDFRRPYAESDVGTCQNGPPLPGAPAQCDRMVLAQVEYRADLHFHPFHLLASALESQESLPGLTSGASWVIFADAGRGWLLGPRSGALFFPRGDLPGFSSFRTDAGLGIDFGLIGVYVAKAVSVSKEPANVFVRVRHRF